MDRVVFVLHDVPVIAQSLAAILSRSGFVATAYDHPDQVFAAAKHCSPDLLVSAVTVAGTNGMDLAIRLCSEQAFCKVLLFSSCAQQPFCQPRASKDRTSTL
jgi:FixJ family two-component response regulator